MLWAPLVVMPVVVKTTAPVASRVPVPRMVLVVMSVKVTVPVAGTPPAVGETVVMEALKVAMAPLVISAETARRLRAWLAGVTVKAMGVAVEGLKLESPE
jgi:hypothetical protein